MSLMACLATSVRLCLMALLTNEVVARSRAAGVQVPRVQDLLEDLTCVPEATGESLLRRRDITELC